VTNFSDTTDSASDTSRSDQPGVVPSAWRRPDGVIRLLVLPSEEGMRLDLFLAVAAGVSRRAARRLIAAGRVVRNGTPVRVQSRTVTPADVVEVPDETGSPPLPARPTIRALDILYEDRLVIAVDKPAGILSQAAASQDPAELALDQLLLLGLAAREGRRPYLRLVHRLDRLTSGIVLGARSAQALRPLAHAWAGGVVDRRYLAVVEGAPSWTHLEVDRPITRDLDHAWRFRVSAEGRPARTLVRLLGAGPHGTSVLECRLLTGRTHQVRVHLAASGHPVVGDRLYGSRLGNLAPRPLLHAASLTLPHPGGGGTLRITSPLPEDLTAFLGPLGERFRGV